MGVKLAIISAPVQRAFAPFAHAIRANGRSFPFAPISPAQPVQRRNARHANRVCAFVALRRDGVFVEDERIVAVGLLTRKDVRLLGPTFDRLWPVEEAPCFSQLLEAIDEADREIWRDRDKQR